MATQQTYQNPDDTTEDCQKFVSALMFAALQEGLPPSFAPTDVSSARLVTRASAKGDVMSVILAARADHEAKRQQYPLFPPYFICRVVVEGRPAALIFSKPLLGFRTVKNPFGPGEIDV